MFQPQKGARPADRVLLVEIVTCRTTPIGPAHRRADRLGRSLETALKISNFSLRRLRHPIVKPVTAKFRPRQIGIAPFLVRPRHRPILERQTHLQTSPPTTGRAASGSRESLSIAVRHRSA